MFYFIFNMISNANQQHLDAIVQSTDEQIVDKDIVEFSQVIWDGYISSR